ncbi:hypothetical protein AALC25_03670 [Lachnospiraceae bacterium 29-84]
MASAGEAVDGAIVESGFVRLFGRGWDYKDTKFSWGLAQAAVRCYTGKHSQ